MGNKQSAPPTPELISGKMEFFGYSAIPFMVVVYMCAHMLCYVAITSGAISNPEFAKSPHLAAHFLPQFFGFVMLAWLGGGGWLMHMPESDPGPGGYVFAGEQIAMHMLAFQIYELAACIPAKRLRGKHYEFVGHHVITVILSYLAYKHQAYQYWAPCFMGMSEISSVPLAVMDFFKQFKSVKARYESVYEIIQVIFCLLFLPIRGVYWPYSSISFWKGSLETLDSGNALPIPGAWVILIFCQCNILMTMLQWFWATLILQGLWAKVTGGKVHDD